MENLPKGWSKATIQEMCSSDGIFNDGDWVESKDQDPNGEVRLIQLADIGTNCFRDRSSRYLTLENANKLKCSFLKKGDILIARMPDPIGRACIFPLEGKNVTVVDVAFVRSGLFGVNNKWLMHFINSPHIHIEITKLASGTTRKRISRKNLGTIPFPLPPLPEQQRIVAKLDTLFASLENTKSHLEKIPQLLKNFRQSVLTQAVIGKLTEEWRKGKELEEWIIKSLKELTNVIDPNPKHRNPPYFNKGFLFLSTAQFGENDGWNFSTAKYVAESTIIEQEARCRYSNESIAFSRKGTIGETRILPQNKRYALLDSVCVINTKDGLFYRFLNYSLRSEYVRNQVQGLTRGVALKQISLGAVRSLLIPYPPYKEQQEIVRRVESLFAKADAIEKRYETLKQKIDTLPQALLAKAFKGELVEQLESDGDAKDLLAEIQKAKESLKTKPKGRKKIKEEVGMVAEPREKYGKE